MMMMMMMMMTQCTQYLRTLYPRMRVLRGAFGKFLANEPAHQSIAKLTLPHGKIVRVIYPLF